MENCIHSLLPGGDRVEIIIVNDGSKDSTAQIADRYAAEYPSIIKAVHQENGGHGEAVNSGLANASGLYFKVVDSDDWVDADSLEKILETIEGFVQDQNGVDMLVSNFIYDKQGAHHKKAMQYRKYLPTGRAFGWEEVPKMPTGKYMLMHSLIYRTQLLKDCGLHLPKHTFYVDNIFAFDPFPYVKKIYYLDIDFYHYFIGREDQSVNEKVMIKRIDQQIRVNKLMADSFTRSDPQEKHLRRYMFSYLDVITSISSIMLIRAGTDEALEKKKELLDYIRRINPSLAHDLRHTFMGTFLNLPGKAGRGLAVLIYKGAQKVFGFN